LLQVAPEQEVAIVAELEVAVETEVDSTIADHMSVMKLLALVGIYSPDSVIAVVADHEYSVEEGRKVGNSLKGAFRIPEPGRVVVKNMFWTGSVGVA